MRRFAPLAAIGLALAGAAQAAPDDAAIDKRIAALRRQLVELGRDEQAGQNQAEVSRARLALLNTEEAQVRAGLERNRGQLAHLLGALQMRSAHPPPPLLVNPRSARDAVRAAILIRAITPELETRGQAFAAEARAIGRLRRDAAMASEGLFEAESTVADRRADIDRLAAEKRGLERRLYDDGEAEAHSRAMAARVGTVEALVEQLAAANRPAPAAGAPSAFAWPVAGTVARRFGQRGGVNGRSQGWAWKAARGAPVLSPAGGHVEYAGPLKGWGQVVILKIGGGYRLVLAGLGDINVGIGREVAAGEPVGRLNAAAPSSRQEAATEELYLEVRSRAEPVDPARWFKKSARPAA